MEMDETIIYKYLSGRATDEEKQALLGWLHESPGNQAIFFELKAIWYVKQQAVFGNENHLNESLEQLNNRIYVGRHQSRKKHNLFIRWSSVAALFLLLIGISYIYLVDIKKPAIEPLCIYTNEASDDSVKTITLADGTEVWLAAHTTLTYPKDFSGDTRKVHLDGTAFFDVTKDPQHPFIVQTEIAEIKVLGTSFSVNSRLPGDQGETILMTGSVQLKRLGGDQIITLFPGQQALYSKNTPEMEVNEVDANTLTSWRFGIVSLTEATPSEIIQRLEKIYSIKINMDISSIKTNKYNFSFKRSNDFNKVLEQFSCITGETAKAVD
jgi:transmembrane sensor